MTLYKLNYSSQRPKIVSFHICSRRRCRPVHISSPETAFISHCFTSVLFIFYLRFQPQILVVGPENAEASRKNHPTTSTSTWILIFQMGLLHCNPKGKLLLQFSLVDCIFRQLEVLRLELQLNFPKRGGAVTILHQNGRQTSFR